MYRPKDWWKYRNPALSATVGNDSHDATFEAGADAMLEALRAIGFRAESIRDLKMPDSKTITIPTLEAMQEMKETLGCWVFIPDEE